MRKIRDNENGITLVALIVTIVVLLILAGISLSLVLGNNGIVTKATDAKDRFTKAKDNETKDLGSLASSIGEMVGELPSTNETTPYLPTGCKMVGGTNLDTGLVMEDSKNNQYVWIEVPKTKEVYQNSGLSLTEFTDEEYGKIKSDLNTYTLTYRTFMPYSDEWADSWYSSCGIDNRDDYYSLYNKMLKSVYKNGGFWIGRYETGDSTTTLNNTVRLDNSNITDEAVIKEGQQPYNFVTCSQAEKIAETFNTNNVKYNASLMFGIQWDLILKYLETKGVSISDLMDDSKLWGNYNNVNFDIAKGKYNVKDESSYSLTTWNSVNTKYTKTNKSSVLLTTGSTDRNSKQGIYDLAGNVWELTLEKYITLYDCPCTPRGGGFSSFSGNTAYNRLHCPEDDCDSETGFRVCIY